MRWFNFTILLTAAIVLQTGVARIFGLGPQRIMPDLLLLVMVVMAFRGARDQALLPCWILGLVKDLSSAAPLGSYALAFGLLALTITYLRELLYGQRLLPMMLTVLVGSFLVEQMVYLLCVIKGAPLADQYGRLSLGMLFSAGLTAALLPYGHGLLMKLHRWLGLAQRGGYQTNGGY